MDGHFEFVDLAPGSYTVIIHTAAYETVARDVHLPDEFQIWVELQPRRRVDLENHLTAAVTEYQVPKSARRQFAEAQKKARKNDCTGALDHLKKALDIFAQYADARNTMGNCYVVLGQLELAEDAFKQAVALTSSVYPTLNLSDLYVRQGRLQEAEEVLTKAIRQNPQEGDGYYGLALLRFAQDRFEEAAQLCLEAHQRPHRVADVHLLLAKIYLKMEKKASSVGELEAYVRESKPNPVRERVIKFLEQEIPR